MCVLALWWDALWLSRCGLLPVASSYCREWSNDFQPRGENPSSVNTAYPSFYICCLRVPKRCYCEDNHVDALWSVNINRLQRIMPVPEHTNWSLCVYCFCFTGDKSIHFLFLMQAKLQDWGVIDLKTCWWLYIHVSCNKKSHTAFHLVVALVISG